MQERKAFSIIIVSTTRMVYAIFKFKINLIENLWAILDNRVDKCEITNKNSRFEALQLA